jgi:hypothetical protein
MLKPGSPLKAIAVYPGKQSHSASPSRMFSEVIYMALSFFFSKLAGSR